MKIEKVFLGGKNRESRPIPRNVNFFGNWWEIWNRGYALFPLH